ncbi:uncharacterized protein Tco025E_06284 [Trypanosoma conorhini]|uniref:Uncharacterized protein n=1 Tax=Trypanosoma conorhini TaxID=83891 RepID=A0A3R7LF78_9TRYP|nr:uncharacterized protein Tco025E_06284 [Trypanosoma conorhini]RNF13219.1 hypothetical protein Tco025E_06284 [Trypanosoma conorhini]
MGQREAWDVTYILPRGNRAVYRQVPLDSMEELRELTHEAAITSLKPQQKYMLHRSASDEECVVPGFLVYHVPPKELEHLGPMLLSPEVESWRSLLQRQAGASHMVLQIVPRKRQEKRVQDATDVARGFRSTSPLLGDTRPRQPSLSRVGNAVAMGEAEDDAEVPPPLTEAGDPVGAGVTRASSCDVESKSLKFKPQATLARLREHVGVWPHLRSRPPQVPPNSYTLKDGVTPTVRVFALTYVFKYVEDLRRGYDDGEGKMDKFPSALMSRSDLVYFAASVVKIWEVQLVLSSTAMNEKWIRLPQLVRSAQSDYLRNLLGELCSRLFVSVQLEHNRYQKPKRELSPLLEENQCGPSSAYDEKSKERVEADEALRLIEEVTYCSSTGPLSVPLRNPRKGGLIVSLRAPKYVLVHEEIVIVGCMQSRSSIGLFWWLVELGPSARLPEMTYTDENYLVVLPLDALYLQRRIATYQITPSTFLLIIQPGFLLSSRRYRCVVEAYDVRTGDVAVSDVNFDTLPGELPQ